jgi:hypothetical protein
VLQQVSNRLAGRRASGFAKEQGIESQGAELIGQEGNLGGFATRLGAFECDEETFFRHFVEKSFDIRGISF